MAENSPNDVLARAAELLKVLETIRVPALGDEKRCAWCFGERHVKGCRLKNLLDDVTAELKRRS